jgi:hypothetical protein
MEERLGVIVRDGRGVAERLAREALGVTLFDGKDVEDQIADSF